MTALFDAVRGKFGRVDVLYVGLAALSTPCIADLIYSCRGASWPRNIVRSLSRFNNAGTGTPPVPFDEITYEDWMGCVQTNLTGSFLCAQQAFRMMKSQTPQGGRYSI